MTTVTVPGVGGTTISYNFNTAQNTLAQAIAGALAAASVGGTLNVAGTTTTPSVTGFTNELAVSTTGATVFTPAGYTFVADSTAGAMGSFTVFGAQNFIGGDGNLTIYNAPGAGTDTITAGDGNDLFGLNPRDRLTCSRRERQRHVLRQWQRHRDKWHREQPDIPGCQRRHECGDVVWARHDRHRTGQCHGRNLWQ